MIRHKFVPGQWLGIAALSICLLAAPFAKGDALPTPSGTVQNFTYSKPSRPVPETKFLDADGQELDLGAFRGRVVLLNFWATWCAPCIREMPGLNRLQTTLGGPDFTVVAVSQDRGGAKIAGPFLKKVGGQDLDLYIDKFGRLARQVGLIGLPTTVLIDRNGQEIGRVEGPVEWDEPEARTLIEHFIGAGEPAVIKTKS